MPLVFNILIVLEVLATAIREEKEIKGTQTGKEKKKKTVTIYSMLYTENPKVATRKILNLINEFSKVSGYKINTEKPVAFLCINIKYQKENLRKHLNV